MAGQEVISGRSAKSPGAIRGRATRIFSNSSPIIRTSIKMRACRLWLTASRSWLLRQEANRVHSIPTRSNSLSTSWAPATTILASKINWRVSRACSISLSLARRLRSAMTRCLLTGNSHSLSLIINMVVRSSSLSLLVSLIHHTNQFRASTPSCRILRTWPVSWATSVIRHRSVVLYRASQIPPRPSMWRVYLPTALNEKSRISSVLSKVSLSWDSYRESLARVTKFILLLQISRAYSKLPLWSLLCRAIGFTETTSSAYNSATRSNLVTTTVGPPNKQNVKEAAAAVETVIETKTVAVASVAQNPHHIAHQQKMDGSKKQQMKLNSNDV